MNTSSSRNPMELVDRYLQAVRFWVPTPQEDLLTELGEDLRSQIEAKETQLGRSLNEAEVSAILKTCGSPMIVAGRIGPRRHLIGPTLYPIYAFVLKMVLLWILVPVFIFIVGPTNLAGSNGDVGRAVLNTFGDLWSGLFISAGIITLVFAIIERTAALDPKLAQLGVDSKWDPLTLPPLRKQDGKPTLIKSVCEMGFGFFGLIWLLLLPHYPVLILGPAAAFLTAAPLWHTFYVPILFMGLVGIARAAITLARPQWDWFPSLSQLFQTVLTLILLNFMIDAVGHVPRANWYPFVVLATAAQDSPQYIRLAAITNVSILISLASTWLGMCIAGAVQTWQFMQYLRKRNSSAHQPASLNV